MHECDNQIIHCHSYAYFIVTTSLHKHPRRYRMHLNAAKKATRRQSHTFIQNNKFHSQQHQSRRKACICHMCVCVCASSFARAYTQTRLNTFKFALYGVCGPNWHCRWGSSNKYEAIDTGAEASRSLSYMVPYNVRAYITYCMAIIIIKIFCMSFMAGAYWISCTFRKRTFQCSMCLYDTHLLDHAHDDWLLPR